MVECTAMIYFIIILLQEDHIESCKSIIITTLIVIILAMRYKVISPYIENITMSDLVELKSVSKLNHNGFRSTNRWQCVVLQ